MASSCRRNPACRGPSGPARATTRRTPRCCWRRCSGARRARSPARLGDQLAAALGDALLRHEVAGPGFLNLMLSDGWHRAALAGGAGRRRLVRRRRGGPGRADPARVRLGQPDGAAGGRTRASRRLRRRAGADPPAPRPHRLARVLLQRRRLSDPAAGRVRAGAGARRGGARGRLSGRLRRRARGAIPGAATDRRGRGRSPSGRDAAGADQEHARALRRPLRHVLQRARAARGLAERRCERALAIARGRPATSTAQTARCGCARRPSATTRIACSCARAASRRISPPTSPTC